MTKYSLIRLDWTRYMKYLLICLVVLFILAGGLIGVNYLFDPTSHFYEDLTNAEREYWKNGPEGINFRERTTGQYGYLVDVLNFSEPEEQFGALLYLEHGGYSNAVDELINHLQYEKNSHIRHQILSALTRIAPGKAAKFLVNTYLKFPDTEYRTFAILYVVPLGNSLVPELLRAFEDEESPKDRKLFIFTVTQKTPRSFSSNK